MNPHLKVADGGWDIPSRSSQPGAQPRESTDARGAADTQDLCHESVTEADSGLEDWRDDGVRIRFVTLARETGIFDQQSHNHTLVSSNVGLSAFYSVLRRFTCKVIPSEISSVIQANLDCASYISMNQHL